jgi:uncharacterized protein YndB with AHSA1/START domain
MDRSRSHRPLVGPEGFDSPRESVSVDLRAGGHLEVTMVVASAEIAAGMQVDPGTEFPDRSEIVALVEPELLVLRSEAQPEIGLPVPTITRIELHEDGDGRTRLTLTSGPHTEMMAPNAQTGWSQSFDKLERLLAASG